MSAPDTETWPGGRRLLRTDAARDQANATHRTSDSRHVANIPTRAIPRRQMRCGSWHRSCKREVVFTRLTTSTARPSRRRSRTMGVRSDRARYQTVGFGSHQLACGRGTGDARFLSVDDIRSNLVVDPRRHHVGRVRTAAARVAYARALSEEGGLDFVVAPLRTVDGGRARSARPSGTVGVYPLLTGESPAITASTGRRPIARNVGSSRRAPRGVGSGGAACGVEKGFLPTPRARDGTRRVDEARERTVR